MKGSDKNPMFNSKNPGEKYTDSLILLGNKIYGKNVPNAAKGEFFKYKVGKYESYRKNLELHFMDQAI